MNIGRRGGRRRLGRRTTRRRKTLRDRDDHAGGGGGGDRGEAKRGGMGGMGGGWGGLDLIPCFCVLQDGFPRSCSRFVSSFRQYLNQRVLCYLTSSSFKISSKASVDSIASIVTLSVKTSPAISTDTSSVIPPGRMRVEFKVEVRKVWNI